MWVVVALGVCWQKIIYNPKSNIVSLVFDLINVLTPEEVEKLKRMNVAGKEEEVLDILLKHKNKTEPGNELITSKLGISNAFCDKIKSVLLDKSYKQLTTGTNTEIINFLSKKACLPHLMKREILLEEKKLTKQKTGDEDFFNFYKEAFRQYTNLSYRYYDEEFATVLYKKISRFSLFSSRDMLEMKGKMVWMHLSGAGIKAEVRIPEVKYVLLKRIADYEKQAKDTGLVFGQFMVHYLYGFLFGLSGLEASKSLEHYQKMHALFNQPGHDLTEDNLYTAESRLAEALYFCDKHEEAFNLYEIFFKKYGAKARSSLYALAKFIQLGVITENYDTAFYMLQQYMDVHLKATTGTGNIMASLCYAKYYLCKGDLDKGYEYVKLGQKFNPKNLYVQYEIELRNLENAYFYLKGDIEFARTLARKNLKFLQSKGLTMDKHDFGYYYHLILAFYNMQINGKPLNKEQERMYEYASRATWAVYGKLLSKIKQMATGPARK